MVFAIDISGFGMRIPVWGCGAPTALMSPLVPGRDCSDTVLVRGVDPSGSTSIAAASCGEWCWGKDRGEDSLVFCIELSVDEASGVDGPDVPVRDCSDSVMVRGVDPAGSTSITVACGEWCCGRERGEDALVFCIKLSVDCASGVNGSDVPVINEFVREHIGTGHFAS